MTLKKIGVISGLAAVALVASGGAIIATGAPSIATGGDVCQHVIANQKPLPTLKTTPGVTWKQSVYSCDPFLDADGKFNRWEQWNGQYNVVGGESLRIRSGMSLHRTSSTRFHEEAHWITATWSSARREQVRKALGVNYWATPTPGVANLDYFNSATEVISRSTEGCYAGRAYNSNNLTKVIVNCATVDSLLAGGAVPTSIPTGDAGYNPLPAKVGYLPPMNIITPTPTPTPTGGFKTCAPSDPRCGTVPRR